MICFNFSGDAVKAFGRFKFVPVILLVVMSSLTFTSTVQASELVVNGSFEMPVLNDKTVFGPDTRAFKKGWQTFYGQNFNGPCIIQCVYDANGDLILIPGWSILWTDTLLDPVPTPGRVELQTNAITVNTFTLDAAKVGAQKAELDSHDRLMFDASGVRIGFNPNANISLYQEFATCERAVYQLSYWWKSRTTIPGDNDVRVVIGDSVARIHMLTDSWQQETVEFVTDDTGSTGIAFVSIGTGETHGMSLDGVSVEGPNPAIDDCPPPPGECEECETAPIVNGVEWVDPATCVACEPWVPEYSKSGKKIVNGCGLCDTGDKPVTIELLYDGDSYTSHSQDDKFSIVPLTLPLGAFPPTANIVITEDDAGGAILFTGSVKIGETFSFPRVTNAPYVRIFDPADGSLIQSVEFHTSCSQPLERLDTFGAITIWDGTF